MKQIAFVADIHMENGESDPLFRVPGTGNITTLSGLRFARADGSPYIEPNEPYMLRQLAFLLDRVVDPTFGDGLDAIDAEILRDDVRGIIKRQAKEAAARGWWEFDDKHAQALLNATTKPKNPLMQLQPTLTFNLVPFIRAVKDQTTPAKEIDLPPVTNGAAAAQA